MTQHTAENMRFPQLTFMIFASNSHCRIDLHFESRLDCEAAKRQLACPAEPLGEAPDGVVRTGVAMFSDQVLVDAYRAEPLLQLRSNDRCKRLAGASRSRLQAVTSG